VALRPQRASEQLADRIREQIVREGLTAGQRLGRLRDLADRFEVSRPTVREALHLLSAEFQLRASPGPGGGIFIEAMPKSSAELALRQAAARALGTHTVRAHELVEARLLLEPLLAGRAAARADSGEVRRLDLPGQLGDPASVAELDRRLHRLVVRFAGNRIIGAVALWLADAVEPEVTKLIGSPAAATAIGRQHQALIQAIATHDSKAAAGAMREHLLYVRDGVAAA
jgi:GntR family transcriptional regulator, transcriptional repressor for pyruvate dehydrogenase complex